MRTKEEVTEETSMTKESNSLEEEGMEDSTKKERTAMTK
jgi:hypothetical protein